MADDEQELHRLIEKKRSEMPKCEPQSVGKVLAKRPIPTPEQLERQTKILEQMAERERQRQEWDRQRPERERRARWEQFISDRGNRYLNCRLENFVAQSPAQRKIITAVRAFAHKLDEHIAAGDNVLLYGPVGTGKDHLLTGLIWLAIQAHRNVQWRDGASMYADWRDAIEQKTPEKEILAPLISADVLAISDPVPGRTAITDFQAERLARIIDRRYSDGRPTWVTTNVSEPLQLDSLTSPRFADRLANAQSLSLFLNWESFRQRKNVATG